MVSHEDLNTYTHGFDLTLRQHFSKDSVVRLCRSLETKFGEGNVFRPEGIGGGFIEWVSWPGLNKKMAYKSMRILRRAKNTWEWPWVDEDAMSIWVGNYETAIGAGTHGTFLKAFYEAPAWTQQELDIFAECLKNAGFEVKTSKAQKKEDWTLDNHSEPQCKKRRRS
jgi:hypothetical protein